MHPRFPGGLTRNGTLATNRTIAIGDIHGCLDALQTLMAIVRPTAGDTVVTLGDYVDRGPDSRGVIERLLRLKQQCNYVPLLGNHDEMMLQVYDGHQELYMDWLLFGGSATLESYGGIQPDAIQEHHIRFLRECRLFYELERHFFIHGNYLAHVPLAAQPRDTLLWESVKVRQPGRHCSGKTAITGHSSQQSGEILDLGYMKCIDTWCYGKGWLTALDVESGKVWQVDKQGEIRLGAGRRE